MEHQQQDQHEQQHKWMTQKQENERLQRQEQQLEHEHQFEREQQRISNDRTNMTNAVKNRPKQKRVPRFCPNSKSKMLDNQVDLFGTYDMKL